MFEVVRVFTDGSEVVTLGKFSNYESAYESAMEWEEILGARDDEFVAVMLEEYSSFLKKELTMLNT